ncbi:MAG: DNA-directed RNA polymerase subunit alpha [Acidimicrobiaceae bacterium]|nr:DNA-directed RNA polymerase subunit alpha [Acidimicrobiaceae bacterium]
MLVIQRPKVEPLPPKAPNWQEFSIGPLEPGFGYTIGNSLRRTLLSSIPGAAVTQVRFDDAIHEFGTIRGVATDIIDIILNLKDLVLKTSCLEPLTLRLDARGPAHVLAEHIIPHPDVEIINPELVIAIIEGEDRLAMDITVEHGWGYVSAEENKDDSFAIGVIPVDSVYSPVRRVAFNVGTTRVAQSTDYDLLMLDIETDGSITPGDALASAGSTLKALIEIIEECGEDPQGLKPQDQEPVSEVDELDELSIDVLELKERARNCLKRMQIHTLGDLVQQSSRDLLDISNFGEKSLAEVIGKLAERDLTLVGEPPARLKRRMDAAAEAADQQQKSGLDELLADEESLPQDVPDEVAEEEMRGTEEEDELLEGSFAAIDFETAVGYEHNTACAVGVVVFEDGLPIEEQKFLIRPPDNRYRSSNTDLHGIGPADTENSPEFPEVWERVAEMLNGRLVIAHNTAFDVSVLRRSAEFHGYKPDPFYFACTCRTARSALPEEQSYKLEVLADKFGIPLSRDDHHDPLPDAKTAGLLWLKLSVHSNMTHSKLLGKHGYRLGYFDLDDYSPFSNVDLSKKRTPLKSSQSSGFTAKDFTSRGTPDPQGALFGKKVVFTGTLMSMPRREAFQSAVDVGARPMGSISGRTDYLILGHTNSAATGERTNSKHQKALQLKDQGNPIRIIDEDEFFCLIAGDG